MAYREKELVGHGTDYHAEGFGSPIGKLKGINLAIEDMSPRDLRAYDIYEAEAVTLEFEGNITVKGEIITGSRNLQGEIILISFKNCTVTHGDSILFKPEWGVYDMAIGKKVVSAFSGPADIHSFNLVSHVSNTHTIKQEISESRKELESLYKKVREIRETHTSLETLSIILKSLTDKYSNDWLLSIEIAELAHKFHLEELLDNCLKHLEFLKQNRPEIAHLITNGLDLILEKEVV